MNLLIFFYLYFIGVDSLMPINDVNSLSRFRNSLPKISYNKLVKNIEENDVSKIYFTEKLDSVISEKKDVDESIPVYTSTEEIADHYQVTKINPFLTNSLTELSTKNNVEPIFLVDPLPNVYEQMAMSGLGFIGNFFVPFIFLSFIIIFFYNNKKATAKKITEFLLKLES